MARNQINFRTPGGTVNVVIDMDVSATHKVTVKAVEGVLSRAIARITQRAASKSPSSIRPTIKTSQKSARGKNITNKTDSFSVIAGSGDYPYEGKKHSKRALAIPAHVELGTRKRAKRPFMYPAFDQTVPEILNELDGII